MKTKLIFVLMVLVLSGCETPHQKRQRVISQLNTIADEWDGKETPPDTDGTIDPWGKPIQAKVKKSGDFYSLEVWSCGLDGLSKNSDDIVAVRYKGSLNKEVEKATSSVSRGFIKGIRQGWRAGAKDEKEEE